MTILESVGTTDPYAAQEHTPKQWRDTLRKTLQARQFGLDKMDRYFDGFHPLLFASNRFREKFAWLFQDWADNWCEPVVRAVEERLTVTGFRVGDNPRGDADAWDIWQSNEMDLQSTQLHLEALIGGEAYCVVWWGEDGYPEITAHDAGEVAVAFDSRRPRHRQAALRVYGDEWGTEHQELFLPDALFVTHGSNAASDNDTEDGFVANPLGLVPVVPFQNAPRLRRPSYGDITVRSEIHSVIPIQNAVNKLCADMMVGSEYQSYRQRYAIGLELKVKMGEDGKPVVGADGQPVFVEPFTGSADRLWVAENPGVQFGEFGSIDLGQFVKAIETFVQHVASITSTPTHYLIASKEPVSAQALKAAESGLVSKAKRRSTVFGEAWEEVMRIAGIIAGFDQLAIAQAAETMWADPESRTQGELADAAMKRKIIGVPERQLWEDVGYSPQEIERFRQMQIEDSLLNIESAPTPTVPTTVRIQ